MDDLSGGLTSVTVLFAIVLAMSLLIERVIEVLKAYYDLLDSHYDLCKFWTRRAKQIRDTAELKLRVFKYVDPEDAAPVLNQFSEMLLNRQGGYSGTVPILAGDLVRELYVKVATKILSIILGIGAAIWLRLDLLALWHGNRPEEIPPTWSMIISGVILGLGSPIVHKVITTIEKKQKKSAKGGTKPW